MVQIWMKLVIVLATLLATLEGLRAQCPDTGRVRDPNAPAGKSQSTNRQCASFTLSIGIVSVSSPTTCEDSYVWRDGDLFHCGGTANGLCCVPNDHKQWVTLFGPSNTCPQPPAAMPSTVQEAFNIINCGKPTQGRKTFNNSAKCYGCDQPQCAGTTGNPGIASTHGDPAHGELVGGYIAWYKNPDVHLPPAEASLVAGWGAQIANIPASELPSLMRELWLSVQPMEYVQGLVASVVRTEVVGNGELITHSYVLKGSVAADGRFSLTSTSEYEGPGEVVQANFDVSYDHRALYRGQQGATFYSAFSQARPDFVTHFRTVFAEVIPVIDWVRGPLCVPLRSDISWESSPAIVEIGGAPTAVIQIVETYPTLSLPGRRVYDVDGSGVAPRVLRIRTMQGESVLVERLFSAHRELEPGVSRPMKMITRWFEPGASIAHTTETLDVRQVRLAADDEVKSWRRASDQNKWHIFRAQ
jgi:hypothetical protein